MDPHQAIAALGVAANDDWETVRRAYRELLLTHHPDRTDGEGATARTDEVVRAFRCLRDLTNDGAKPMAIALPAPQVGSQQLAGRPTDDRGALVLTAAPGDVFDRMRDALESVGDLSHIDRANGLLGATILRPPAAAAQLLAELTPTGAGHTEVEFTLEPLGQSGDIPQLVEVVDEIAAALALPATLRP